MFYQERKRARLEADRIIELIDANPSLVVAPDELAEYAETVDVPLVKTLFPNAFMKKHVLKLFNRECIPRFLKKLNEIYLPVNERRHGLIKGCPGTGKSFLTWYWFLRQVATKSPGRGCWVSFKAGFQVVIVVERISIKNGKRKKMRLKLSECDWTPNRNLDTLTRGCVVNICDGVTNTSESLYINSVKHPRILVTSGGYKQTNDLNEAFIETYPSWTEEEHLKACQNKGFWKSVSWAFDDIKRNQVKEKDTKLTKENMIRLKSYYVEGSARWMYTYTHEAMLKILVGSIQKVSSKEDCNNILSGKSVEYNHLRAFRMKCNEIIIVPLSPFVTKCLFDTYGVMFLKSMKTRLKHELKRNKALQGWLLELQFEAKVKDLFERKRKAQKEVDFVEIEFIRYGAGKVNEVWNVKEPLRLKQHMKLDEKTKELVRSGALVLLLPYNFPAVDFFVMEKVSNNSFGIRFGNITCGNTHTVLFDHIRRFISYLEGEMSGENSSAVIEWLELAFILPSQDTPTNFKFGKLQGFFREGDTNCIKTKSGDNWTESNATRNIRLLVCDFDL